MSDNLGSTPTGGVAGPTVTDAFTSSMYIRDWLAVTASADLSKFCASNVSSCAASRRAALAHSLDVRMAKRRTEYARPFSARARASNDLRVRLSLRVPSMQNPSANTRVRVKLTCLGFGAYRQPDRVTGQKTLRSPVISMYFLRYTTENHQKI